MKRYMSFILIMVLIWTGASAAFGNKYVETGQIALTDAATGKTEAYKAVNLVMGGQDVITDIPAILYELQGKTRTLVPLRFIIDSLGAEVHWDNDAHEATIILKNKVIILKADSATAIVDGVPVELPDKVPVKLMGIDYNYRTLIPIRFVSEQLGLDVGWIQSTQTVTINKSMQAVTGVSYKVGAGPTEIVFKTTGEVDFSSYFLKAQDVGGTDQVILDMANTIFDVKSGVAADHHYFSWVYANGIRTIDGFQAETSPYRTRFIVSLDRKMGYEVTYDAASKEIRMIFGNSINQIKTEKIYNAETVIIRTAEAPTYNVKFNQGQVVVDFIDSKLALNNGQPGTMAVGKGGIDSIDFSQANPAGEYDPTDKIARVEVNLKSGQSLEDVYIEDIDSDLYIYVSGNPLNGFDYGKDSLDTAHLNINTLEPTAYDLKHDKANNQLILTIPQNAVNLDTMNLDIADNVMDNILIKTAGANYEIALKLSKNTIFVDNTASKVSGALKFIFVNDSLNKLNYNQKLIVIDAGHGGKDPGAISPFTGSREKDMALTIAQKLKKKLENIGYKVYMTRDDDTYVELRNRAEIANNLGANAFLSIHINASTSQTPKGVEMLYVADSRDSRNFAQYLQTEVVKATGAKSIGLIERPNLVVIRETRMSAVLAELGFLTNASEERLLLDESYQDKLVQGLYNAITKYVK